MPYGRLPRVVVKELVSFASRAHNMLIAKDGISQTISPECIVTGKPKPDYRCMKLAFGTYVQVYNGTSNDTKSRTLGAILNPTGKAKGDYYFLSLATGEKIHRRSWVDLPISDLVISRVEAIALEEEMPPVDGPNSIIEYNPGHIVDETEYDKDYHPPKRQPPQRDHELTTDAYTSSKSDSEIDDTDEESTVDETGHHSDYDGETSQQSTTDDQSIRIEDVEEDSTDPSQEDSTPRDNKSTEEPITTPLNHEENQERREDHQ